MGKTTFLRQMARQVIPGWPRSMRVLLVEQENVGDSRTPIDSVMEADAQLQELWFQQRMLRESLKRCVCTCACAWLFVRAFASFADGAVLSIPRRNARLLTARLRRVHWLGSRLSYLREPHTWRTGLNS